MSRKTFKNLQQIKLLTPQQLLLYHKELIECYYDMLEEIEIFNKSYKDTKKVMLERLKATEQALKLAERDRVNLDPDFPSIIYDDTKLSIN